LRNESNNLQWAIWPAGAFMSISILYLLENAMWFEDDYILPVIFIVVGLIIIFTGLRKK